VCKLNDSRIENCWPNCYAFATPYIRWTCIRLHQIRVRANRPDLVFTMTGIRAIRGRFIPNSFWGIEADADIVAFLCNYRLDESARCRTFISTNKNAGLVNPAFLCNEVATNKRGALELPGHHIRRVVLRLCQLIQTQY